ncbi:HAMP domain-containing sensor histidine kinase [Opitutus sp. ER46]|uniref:sensor histidine kinase n=1 Tax=Opitutus sp. ER46 TaxID=2161864 RepID=UPI001304B242|nr:HAMP domain-containing sensor histidine kinase [Opitutus sp. ER46]
MTLLVFAGVVAYVSLWLRQGLREQVLRREAETLTEIAAFQLATEAESLAKLGLPEAPGELLNAVLKTSKLRGVFAVRVLDADQNFAGALPLPWTETPPAAKDWAQLAQGVPVARLHARESAAEVIGLAPPTTAGRAAEPLVETWLPLRATDKAPLAGVAQMWTDGHAVAMEFAAIDRRVLLQALLAWTAGAAIISVLLTWAFRRLAQANRMLQARSEDLLRANRELTLAAKTSALGAVAAHLVHELKNPVAGLEEYVASQSEQGARGDGGGELAAASELTRRLRTMINDVVGVMRDEQQDAGFELTAAEVLELVFAKARPLAEARGVQLETAVAGDAATLPARRSNLTRLVLQNLLQNAIEATPRGRKVRLSAESAGGTMSFAVADEGPGLPAAVQARLFQPCPSGKPGGSGLGLALSQQLARQADGRIVLERTGATGTCFQLVLDARVET